MVRVRTYEGVKTKAKALSLLLVLVVAGLLLTTNPAQANTYTVKSGEGTEGLQAAIDEAKNHIGPDVIDFTDP